MKDEAGNARRASKKQDWLRKPQHPQPAHTQATCYVPASPKVQAHLRDAQRQLRKVQPALRRVAPTMRKVQPVITKTAPLIRRENARREALDAKPCAPEPVTLTAPLAAPRERRERAASAPARGDPDDPDEPPGARPCACGCGLPRREHLQPPQRYYYSHECRKRHARQRQDEKRQRERARRG